ncbi:phosphoribosylformylglycinamidine cyclo-ligase [Patescibacteria group bacterium]|nr:phosphoribosylformylglycinamidine cyclo-ligase [Patescibacteria group bacterium]
MSISYKQSGVNIDAGNEAVSRIKDKVKTTFDNNVVTGLGSFGAMYDLSEIVKKYKKPILAQSIDGVGTKLKVAKMAGKFESIGEDIVNHSCNDILCQGARPLTFLDYIAADKIEPKEIEEIVFGMAKACKENSVSLIGGETAEMPGVYEKGEHDIAGCITGIVEKDKIITGDKIQEGDLVLGLGSSGLHTNGFSLVRKIFFEMNNYTVDSQFEELHFSLGKELLTPHRNYANPVLKVLDEYEVKGIAHITGGGLIENIPRVLPQGLSVEIKKHSWEILPIFKLIQKLGNVPEEEMYRVFNMGVGLVLIIGAEDFQPVIKDLEDSGEKVYEIGRVVGGSRSVKFI